MDEAIDVVRAHAEAGLFTTVDVLGENLEDEESVSRAMDEYILLCDRLGASGAPDCQVSVKLTMLGLRFDAELALANVMRIVEHGRDHGVGLCIDMEDSSTTSATLDIFRRVRPAHENVSVAVQAYLKRSEDDVRSLLPLAPEVRVCKGIYRESPDVAYQDRQEIRDHFVRLVRLLLEGGGRPAVATHDPWIVDACLDLFLERGGAVDAYEFQMLLGVGEGLRARIRRSGARLRIYCPYGPRWREYTTRRLRENPRIVGYVLRQLLTPGERRR